ncbi:MAG TPA: hypothetical protein VH352_26960 [Pseudonocardiaceae bacterium]|jgi:hypothetical protein|nr:hypothetical protein [Pseudonocardiaceae bacterium]
MTTAATTSSTSGFEENFNRLVEQRVSALRDMGDKRPVEQITAHVRMDLQQRVEDYQSRMR